jgi:hypothetical protein
MALLVLTTRMIVGAAPVVAHGWYEAFPLDWEYWVRRAGG